MTIHLQVHSGDATTDFRFSRKEITIGSADDNDLVLKHASVADRHARLVLHPELGFALSDGGNRAVLTVNGLPFDPMHTVSDGDIVGIGAYTMTFRDREPPGPDEAAFLGAIDGKPSEDETRLVYADWLEERGRADEARFLRVQLAIPKLDPGAEHFTAAAKELQALAGKLPLSWRRTVARVPIENCDVRFELQCPQRWDALQETASPGERFCHACEKNVHYAADTRTARRLAFAGACVAVDIASPRRPRDLLAPERLMMVGRISAG